MAEENKKEIKVEYTGSYGFINAADQKNVIFFDDEENIGKKELSRSKIIDIKIYTKIILQIKIFLDFKQSWKNHLFQKIKK